MTFLLPGPCRLRPLLRPKTMGDDRLDLRLFLKAQCESKGTSGEAGALLVSQSKYNERHERTPSDRLG